MNDGDPTIVTKLLDDFNGKGAGVRLGGSPLPFATRLRFDDSNSEAGTPARKRKWDMTDVQVSDMSLDTTQNVTESPWESRRLKADLVAARAQISNLEMRVSQLHSLRKELEVVFETEKESLLRQQERDRNLIQELEAKISALRKRDVSFKDCSSANISTRRSVELEKLHSDKKLQKLQRQNMELKSTLEEAKSTHRSTERELNNQIFELNHAQSVLKSELSQEREVVKNLETRVKDLEQGQLKLETLEIQLQEYQHKISELESEREAAQEAREMAMQQQEKLIRFPELEKECARLNEDVSRLKEAVQRKIMLEEEVSILRLRCSSSEEREKWASKLQTENSEYVSKLAEWQGIVRDFCPGVEEAPVQAIRNLILKLQETELVLTSAIAEKESEANACRAKQQHSELGVKKLETEITQLKSTNEQLSNQLRRINKKLALITGERNSYRVQLDLYEKDLTVSQSQQTQQAQTRISELEQFLQGYRELVDRLEADLSALSGAGGAGSLAEQLQAARKRQLELESERDELMARCDNLELQMEHRALKGDFNPGATRILHYRQNPASIAQATVEKELETLREENSRLKARVKILQEGDRDDITCKVEQRVATSNSKELQDLQEQVKSADLLNQRLKEYFKRTSQEFRDCVYQLFGWKVDRLQNKGAMFRLSSMYAESPSDHLLFQMGNDSSMTLIETDFSSTLEEFISLYLSQQHSLPMFLSAVTMELFSRSTMSITQPVAPAYDAITLD